ncbi:MAG: cupin domain-containing protein, partial [Acidobacteria bacterium]|nr:cupin domain-containing protein [Acidobacteriota bacterium]
MAKVVRNSQSVPIESISAGTSTARQVLITSDEASNFAMRKFTMQPGGGMPKHTNSVEHEQYVLRGRARIGLGDEVVEVKEGDALYIPAGTPHWYEALGDEPFEFLCMVPNKEDRIEILE